MQCPNPIWLRETKMHVPCGKCPACRKRIANTWVTRLMEEEKHSRSCQFVTLTYDDFNLPKTKKGLPTLVKKDLQDFINLLRTYCPFRYFAIGEYGDKGSRPHYHLIIFNFFPVTDPKTGNIVYHRDWDKITKQQIMSNVDIEAVIYKAWRKKGLVDVQNLEGGAIRYVAYYTVDPTVRSVDNDQQKQFAIMSKRPPIGYQYYTDKANQRYHFGSLNLDRFCYQAPYGKTILPRIYRKKLYTSKQVEKLVELNQQKEDEKFKYVKDVKKYAKAKQEAYIMEDDKIAKLSQQRKL